MRNFNTLLASVLVAVLYASSASAIPIVDNSKHATHSRRQLRSGRTLTTYHPRSTFETYGDGIDHPLRKRAGVSLKESSLSWVQSKLDLQEDAVTWQSGFTATHAKYAYVKQSRPPLHLASYAPSTPSLDLETALGTAEAALGGSNVGLPAPELKYFAKEDGSAALVHSFQVKNEDDGSWYEALVDAHNGDLLSVVDYVAHATYLVLPITKQVQTEGFETLGWHFDGQGNTTSTAGNNVIAFKGSLQSVTQESAADLIFEFPEDPTQEPTVQVNLDASRTAAFYLVNTVHDIAYRYGFTEDAFNFQFDNLGHGGLGGDPVTASVQDASGVNNANFAPGKMRMFLFTSTKPSRDGALENDVVVHENMHGITNRMTGGGTAACLQSLEAGGMGEGWSDAMAEWTEQKDATIKDYVVGAFVGNKAQGLRSKPYSTDKTVNPLTFASAGQLQEVHNIGEVWANMLHNVYAALVDDLGFASDAATNRTGPRATSSLPAHLVSLKFCFSHYRASPACIYSISARDAWVQADANRFNGANRCTVLKAFASRGLGTNAANFVDDFTIPADC
ncbi:Fungalysin metallopeptidase-domain-containing protein [Mycena rosella]|uniref:Extracellular metalloproteinase n=1 Tax=Mycena rosella TaxID=1033263 RepID=A0AAD7FM41_MYCRO|nr:Fungalysin metallopeptidase-domain-containing protein [Mycena rosella]